MKVSRTSSIFTRALAVGLLFTATGLAGGLAQAQHGLPTGQLAAVGSSREGAVDPAAVAALKRMSAYLRTLNTMEITSEGSFDAVTNDDQRVQMDGVTTYKIRRPGLVIDFVSDAKSRRFIYDGKTFTVFAPTLNFYSTVPAPPTNPEVVNLIYERYGIAIPLADLFRWASPDGVREKDLTSGYQLGTATLEGVKTDHYVFRQKDIDWEVWIQQGDQPLPRKLVIVDRTDSTRPTFIARLKWKLNPPLTDADFAFTPGKDDKPIELTTFVGPGK
jgi:hypothetical protein